MGQPQKWGPYLSNPTGCPPIELALKRSGSMPKWHRGTPLRGLCCEVSGRRVLVYLGRPEAHEDDVGSRNGNGA